ncbi:MAG: hypothetical protein JKY84_07990, partial [Emcibacteraceae bacterium]|nr:hypothetical protein [Emcibacteraceae bacterium]
MTTEQTAQQYPDPVSLLKWYAECGVDETISDSTTNWFEVADNIHLKQQVKSAGTIIPKRAAQPALPTNKEIIEQAATLAA